jgi:hypothetical protein
LSFGVPSSGLYVLLWPRSASTCLSVGPILRLKKGRKESIFPTDLLLSFVCS